MGAFAAVCGLFFRLVGVLLLVFVGSAFFFQWNNPIHSELIANPKGHDMAPNFRGAKGEYFLNKDNLWIHYERYLPKGDAKDAKGLVLWVHGYDTHSGHFADAAQKVADETNLIVITWDHQGIYHHLQTNIQGWGLSEGDRMYFASLADIRDDFVQLSQEKKKEYNITNNVFCFGHSMSGGLLVWDHLNRLENGQSQVCQGLILSAPGVILDPVAEEFANGQVFGALNSLGTYFPKMILFPKLILASAVSSLPEFQETWSNDPLVHTFARVRTGTNLVHLEKDIAKNRSKVNIPYFLFVGTEDPYLTPELAQKFVDSTASKDKTIRVYEGDRHSVLNDKHAEEAIEEISSWIKQHTK